MHIGNKLAVVAGMLVIASALISRPSGPFSPKQKAFYLEDKQVSFVRPGLEFKITKAETSPDGTVTVRFRITDAVGLPLDRDGVQTPGSISTSFVLAKLPKGKRFYEAYTTRVKRSTFPGSEGKSSKQASSDSGGIYRTLENGQYEYTFGTKLPASFELNATHTISIYGSRNLSEFDLGTNYASSVFSWVPDGSPVVDVRDVINDRSCNACHDQISFHGGSRRGLETCVLCHSPSYGDVENINPETGNTISMEVMTHKIHMGSLLPSVKEGKPYQFVGFGNAVADYSKITMPSEINNCAKCHETTATQNKAHLQFPSRNACGSCHDNVNFATGAGHANGIPQQDDNSCSRCHIARGDTDFDASIFGAHVDPTESSMIEGVVLTIQNVTNTNAGDRPVVNFTVKDRKGNVLEPSKLNRIAFTLAGPTSDYGEGLPVTGGYVQESASAATPTLSGWSYRFSQAIPPDAKGSYSIYGEARREEKLMAGTLKERTVRTGSPNAVHYFSVDGSATQPRRQIVDTKRCNDCHRSLSVHGENRNSAEACAVCHNARMTDAARRPAGQGPAESIDFSLMTHRIHAGKQQQRDYTIYGFGGTAYNFNAVGFPSNLSNCDNCHLPGTAALPVKAALDKLDPRAFIASVKPASAACLSCHTSSDAAAHALANTSSLGESCAACHGEGKRFSVSRVHAQ